MTHEPVETTLEVDVNPIESTKEKREAHVRTRAEITQIGDGRIVVLETMIDRIRNQIDHTKNANSTTGRAAIVEIDQIPAADHATNVMAWATSYYNVPVHTGTEKMVQ